MFLLGTYAFSFLPFPWYIFLLLFLLPDLSMLGYLAGPRLGAMVYNALHSTLGPALLAGLGLFLDHSMLLGIAAIWGLIILGLLSLIPIAGGLIGLLATMFGLGLLLMTLFRARS